MDKALTALSLAIASALAPYSMVTPGAGVSLAAIRTSHSRHIYKGTVSVSMQAADRLLLTGKYQAAADHYQSILKRNPHDTNAMVGLGLALAKQFKLDGADVQFDKVLARDPSNPGAHTGKALVLLNRLNSSSNTIRKSRDSILKEAEAQVNQALQGDRQIPEAHYAMGMVYKEQGHLPEAATEFSEAVREDGRFSDGYSGRGLVKLAQGNPGGATADFKQAISINSGDYTAHYGLGQALLNQGQTDAAIKELNTALYLFPNSWPVHLALGKAYETQGNTVAAVSQYQESIRIKPENTAAYLGIANIRETRGDIEHSIAELRSGLELMPNDVDLHVRIGDQSLRVDKYSDAIKEYETVLSTDPGNAKAADGLTTAFYMKANKETTGGFFGDNDYDEAIAMLNKAVQMNPNDMRLRLAQAKLRMMSGEEVDLSTIGTPQNDGDRISYAQALLAQNRFQESANQMSLVISHAQNAKQAFAIADLALMIHDLDSAEQAYQRASNFPGSAERSHRGLGNVTKARQTAQKNLNLAEDLGHKKMTNSAIDTFHDAVYANPRSADARLGLAKTIEQVSNPTPVQSREAAFQYRAYVGLMPNMPEKDKNKFLKKAEKLDVKAYKKEQKEQKVQAP